MVHYGVSQRLCGLTSRRSPPPLGLISLATSVATKDRETNWTSPLIYNITNQTVCRFGLVFLLVMILSGENILYILNTQYRNIYVVYQNMKVYIYIASECWN